LAVSKSTIGELRHRITFQNLTLMPDGQGGSDEVWADAFTVWASVVPKNKSERLFSAQIQYQRTHQIIIRWREGVSTEQRILFKGRVFQIHAFSNYDERRFFITIDAEENQGT